MNNYHLEKFSLSKDLGLRPRNSTFTKTRKQLSGQSSLAELETMKNIKIEESHTEKELRRCKESD